MWFDTESQASQFLNQHALMYHYMDAHAHADTNLVTILLTMLMPMLPLLFRCSKVLADGSLLPIIATTHQFISTQCSLCGKMTCGILDGREGRIKPTLKLNGAPATR